MCYHVRLVLSTEIVPDPLCYHVSLVPWYLTTVCYHVSLIPYHCGFHASLVPDYGVLSRSLDT